MSAEIEPFDDKPRGVDRNLEQVIRELRAAESKWLPKHRAAEAAWREWKRLSEFSDKARYEVLALRKEAEEYLKAVGPR